MNEPTRYHDPDVNCYYHHGGSLPCPDQSAELIHEHSYKIQISIPLRFAGAVHGYSDYRECTGCDSRVPAECVRPDGTVMTMAEYQASQEGQS